MREYSVMLASTSLHFPMYVAKLSAAQLLGSFIIMPTDGSTITTSSQHVARLPPLSIAC